MDDAFWLSFLALWIMVGTLALIQIDSWMKIVKLHRRLTSLSNQTFGAGPAPTNGLASNSARLPWEGHLPDDTGLVLAFTASCNSCVKLARQVADAIPHLPPTVILLDGKAGEDAGFLADSGLPLDRVIRVVGVVLQRLGLNHTPTALWLQSGRQIKVARVEDIRDVEALLDIARQPVAGSAAISGGDPSS
jgi:hypothetical protein